MGASLAVAQPVEEAGVVLAAACAAGAFLLRSERARALAVLAALALTPALVLAELWETSEFRSVRDNPGALALVAVAGVALAAGLAALLLRRPLLFPVLAVIAMPFRVPVDAGSQTANLLVPLYLVVGAGCLAYAWERRGGGTGTFTARERRPRAVELALLAALVLYALQSVYSTDFDQALNNVVFFYVPFALMLKLLAGVEWSARLVKHCLAAVVALALLFACVGFFQYATKELLWNPKVIEANRFESYFRVNSLFFDPNIYGRFLGLAMIVTASLVLWGRRNRDVLLAGGALAVLWAGLVLSFSRSSFAALLAGLVVLAGVRFGPGRVAGLAVALATVAVAAALLVPGLTDLDLSSGRAVDRESGGRRQLVEDGIGMLADRPLHGYGSGSFEERFRERENVSSERANAASHTIPITVAAEQGVIGLVAYLLVLGTALLMLFGGLHTLRGRDPPVELVARAAAAAAFAALAVHTLMYAAFLEDPLAWALVGIGLGLRVSAGASASGRRRAGSSTGSRTAGVRPR